MWRNQPSINQPHAKRRLVHLDHEHDAAIRFTGAVKALSISGRTHLPSLISGTAMSGGMFRRR